MSDRLLLAFVSQVCVTDAAADMEEGLKVLMKADPDQQETLQTEVIPDPMEGEQTWPTEEELDEANGQWQQTWYSSDFDFAWLFTWCSCTYRAG